MLYRASCYYCDQPSSFSQAPSPCGVQRSTERLVFIFTCFFPFSFVCLFVAVVVIVVVVVVVVVIIIVVMFLPSYFYTGCISFVCIFVAVVVIVVVVVVVIVVVMFLPSYFLYKLYTCGSYIKSCVRNSAKSDTRSKRGTVQP